MTMSHAGAHHAPDSAYAWYRLAVTTVISTIGCVGMWSMPVVLPAIQSEFSISRGEASLPFTLTMIGFAGGGVLIGRMLDRMGILLPVIAGATLTGGGYILSSFAPSLWPFALMQGALIGLGNSAFFAPLMADISHWFVRRRGIAVAICASGNYVAGAIWPVLIQHSIAAAGWRMTHIYIGIAVLVIVLPLALLMRTPPPRHDDVAAQPSANRAPSMSVSPAVLQFLLCVAGIACCVAMAMPQVHIVAYCSDLGYGVARGAEMLALMLGSGIISRVASGFIADRIGGVRTLLLGSILQGLSLILYLLFDGLASLYIISALFGLFQGGIVPSYAIIVREYFPREQAGFRIGFCIMATILGMALGGWMSGVIFDLTGSYRIAFLNGIGWNLLNLAIALWLLARLGRRQGALAPALS